LTVTAAAVLAFLLAAVEVAIAVGNFALGAAFGGYTQTQKASYSSMASSGLLYLFGVIGLVLAALLVWGAVATVRGQTSRILAIVVAAGIVLGIVVSLMVDRAYMAVGTMLPVVIAFLLISPSSKEFFQSSGKRNDEEGGR
jgi:hypothetical protein